MEKRARASAPTARRTTKKAFDEIHSERVEANFARQAKRSPSACIAPPVAIRSHSGPLKRHRRSLSGRR